MTSISLQIEATDEDATAFAAMSDDYRALHRDSGCKDPTNHQHLLHGEWILRRGESVPHNILARREPYSATLEPQRSVAGEWPGVFWVAKMPSSRPSSTLPKKICVGLSGHHAPLE